MFEKFKLGLDNMALTMVIWLCTLPLIGLFVIPLFGPQVGLAAAVILFIAALLICWGICSWQLFRE